MRWPAEGAGYVSERTPPTVVMTAVKVFFEEVQDTVCFIVGVVYHNCL
jgi:hypothetical protein